MKKVFLFIILNVPYLLLSFKLRKLEVATLCLLFLITFSCKNTNNETEVETEVEPEYEVYENHDISACGVNDPLRNLDWLAEFTEENRRPVQGNLYYYWNLRIELYANTDTYEEYIVFFYSINMKHTENYSPEPPDPYFAQQVYTCLGERLFILEIEDGITINDLEWDKFFYSGKNESQGKIWNRNRIK